MNSFKSEELAPMYFLYTLVERKTRECFKLMIGFENYNKSFSDGIYLRTVG